MKKNKVQYLNEIKELVKDNADYVAFIEAEVERIQKRAGKVAEKRAEKNGVKAGAYEEAIRQALADAERAITLAELVAATGIEDATPGRVAYYAGNLVDTGEVEREKAKVGDRKVTVYKLAQ